ncbi:unnamed protein product, partial [Sphacelaria rigidula]
GGDAGFSGGSVCGRGYGAEDVFPAGTLTERLGTAGGGGGGGGVSDQSALSSRGVLSAALLSSEGAIRCDGSSTPTRRRQVGVSATVRRPPSPQFVFFSGKTEAERESPRFRDESSRERRQPPLVRRDAQQRGLEVDVDDLWDATDETRERSRETAAHQPQFSKISSATGNPLLPSEQEPSGDVCALLHDADNLPGVFVDGRRQRMAMGDDKDDGTGDDRLPSAAPKVGQTEASAASKHQSVRVAPVTSAARRDGDEDASRRDSTLPCAPRTFSSSGKHALLTRTISKEFSSGTASPSSSPLSSSYSSP